MVAVPQAVRQHIPLQDLMVVIEENALERFDIRPVWKGVTVVYAVANTAVVSRVTLAVLAALAVPYLTISGVFAPYLTSRQESTLFNMFFPAVTTTFTLYVLVTYLLQRCKEVCNSCVCACVRVRVVGVFEAFQVSQHIRDQRYLVGEALENVDTNTD